MRWDWKLRYGKAQQRGAADAAAGTLTLLAKREGLQCDIYFVLRAYANCNNHIYTRTGAKAAAAARMKNIIYFVCLVQNYNRNAYIS